MFYSLGFALCSRSASLMAGTRRNGGYLARCVFTRMRGLGTRTQATGITAGCSSLGQRGYPSAEWYDPTSLRRVNSSTALGLSIVVTDTRGVSGELPVSAGSDE